MAFHNFKTHPRESNAADCIAKHVAKDGGVRVASREVGVESWVLPVSHLKSDQNLEHFPK